MVASPASSSQSALRRPSELNAAADLVGLGGANKLGDETPPPEEKEGNSNAKNAKKSSKSKASGKKKGGPSDVGDKAVAESGDADSCEGMKASATTADSTAQITALSIIKDEMANGAASSEPANSILPAVPPLPKEDDGPLKKKIPGAQAATHGGNDDDQMIVDEHGEKTSFPLLLHNVVTDPATDDCIHWLSCGTRFIISDKKKFAKDVLPRFYGPAKFTSFTRRLKRWSFARVPSGPFMGAYFNPNFRRGEPELAHRVRYNHPSPLSGAGLAMQQQKLAAVKGANMMMPMNMNMAGMSDSERADLFRQMNGGMAPMMGGMNMGMMGMNYGMMMGGPMMNQNMMMMGGGVGMGGYGKDESGKNPSGNDMSGGGAAAGGGATNPSALAMLMEQQERQRLAFQQQQMGGGNGASNQGSNQELMNGMNNPSGGGAGGGTNTSFNNLLGGQGDGGGGVQGMGNFPVGGGGGYGQGGPGMMGQGNLNTILAQYMTQGSGNRSMMGNQGKMEEGDGNGEK